MTLAPDFPPVGYDQWRTSVVAELKGAPFERKLVPRTLVEAAVRSGLITAADGAESVIRTIGLG